MCAATDLSSPFPSAQKLLAVTLTRGREHHEAKDRLGQPGWCHSGLASSSWQQAKCLLADEGILEKHTAHVLLLLKAHRTRTTNVQARKG